MITLRSASPADAPALLAVYARYIGTPVTFECALPAETEFARRVEDITAVYPYLAAEEDGAVTGYAYAHPFAERAAYQWGAELSVYLDPGYCGRGLGRRLYTALLDLLRLQGVRTVYGVVTLPNPASEALHRSLGFTRAGVFHNAGFRLGQWRDVAWFQRDIGPYDTPEPLRKLRDVDETLVRDILRRA